MITKVLKKNSNYKKDLILYILLVAIVSFSFGFINYRGTIHNYRQYTLLINSAQDDSYLANDFFIQQNKGFNARYFVIQTIVFIDRFFDELDITIPFLYSVTVFLISLNICLLSYFYFKDKKFSILASIMSIFLVHFNLGGLALIRSYLDSNMLSTIFILSGLNLLLRKKIVFGYFILGFAILFQPIDGLLMYGTYIFVQNAPEFLKLNLKRIVANTFKSLSFFVSSSFNLIPLIIDSLKTAVPEKNAIIASTWVFFGWTGASPFSWPLERYILYGLFFVIALVISYKRIKQNKHEIYFYAYLIITGLFLMIGIIFVEIWPVAFITKAQTSRILIFFSAFAYIFIIRYIYLSVIKSRYLIEKILIMIVPIFFFSQVSIKIGLLSLFVLLIFEKYEIDIYKKLKNLSKYKTYIFLPLLFFSIILGLLILKLFKNAFAQLGSSYFVFRLLYLIFVVSVYLSLFIYLINKRNYSWLIVTIPLLLIMGLLTFSMRDISEQTACDFLYEPSQYIKQNTEQSSLFLVPLVGWANFRLCANRAVVVDLTTVFTDKSILEWHDRILDVTKFKELRGRYNDISLNNRYHALSDQDIKLIQQKYEFNYAAFEKNLLVNDYRFPVFYEDKDIIIYKTD